MSKGRIQLKKQQSCEKGCEGNTEGKGTSWKCRRCNSWRRKYEGDIRKTPEEVGIDMAVDIEEVVEWRILDAEVNLKIREVLAISSTAMQKALHDKMVKRLVPVVGFLGTGRSRDSRV